MAHCGSIHLVFTLSFVFVCILSIRSCYPSTGPVGQRDDRDDPAIIIRPVDVC